MGKTAGDSARMARVSSARMAVGGGDPRPIPGAWLKAALKASKVSQAELSRRVEVATTTINRRCQEDSPISYEAWLGMLHALGLPADWRPPSKGRRGKR